MSAARGTLFLVAGPSGAGKDSLLHAARQRVGGAGGPVFPRRTITRPHDAGGEDHEAVDAPTFQRLRDAGGFLLHWRAHGLDYGVPAACGAHLAAGRSVVVNVSRGVIDEARARLQPVRVLLVTAPVAVLSERLRSRGREDETDIAARVQRALATMPTGDDVIRIINDGSLDEAADRFVAALVSKALP